MTEPQRKILYKFYSKPHGLQAIVRQRLKVTTISELNDPFEFKAISYKDRRLRAFFDKATKSSVASRGLICFSKSWGNPVIWSHYADRHRGICLGIDVPTAAVIDVDYRSERLPNDFAFEPGLASVPEGVLRQNMSTKFDHWRYEDEARFFCRTGDSDIESGLYFIPFESCNFRLSQIILGPAYVPTNDPRYMRLAEDLGAEVVTTRLAFDTFTVVRQRASRKLKVI